MERREKLILLPVSLFCILITFVSVGAKLPEENPGEEETVLVGRVSHVEGELLRYVPEEDDWIATVKDTPFGVNDSFYSDNDARAEFILPNNTWVRIGGDTQIQLIVLKKDITEIDLASSVGRFYNKGSDALIKVVTPFGYVIAPEESSFDVHVGDESVEVLTLSGRIYFVNEATATKYEVIAGSSSIVADRLRVTVGNGYRDPLWAAWNMDRDDLWANRLSVRGESVRHLPPWLHDDAYVLEENGEWESVYYDGAYEHFWRPVNVSLGWAPFTVGRWTIWYGDNTWVPYEPFGYITHHYGHWVFVDDFWYWAPPVVRVRVHTRHPKFYRGFAWYPGKVAWINFGVYVGWVPLAPGEPYYCRHRWGPHAIVVKNDHPGHIHLRLNRYRNFKRAVIIRRNNFYSVENYRKVGIRHKNRANFVQKYKVAPVVNDKVIRNRTGGGVRYHSGNPPLLGKPSRNAVKRIRQNQYSVRQHASIKAEKMHHNVREIRRGRLVKGALRKNPIPKNSRLQISQDSHKTPKLQPRERTTKGGTEFLRKNHEQAGKKTHRISRRRSLTQEMQGAIQQKDKKTVRQKLQSGNRRMPTVFSRKEAVQPKVERQRKTGATVERLTRAKLKSKETQVFKRSSRLKGRANVRKHYGGKWTAR